MNQLEVKGTQLFMNKNIPIVLGGFGIDKKCISDKTISEIHSQPEREIRRRITDNIKRFQDNVDYIDLVQRVGESHTLDFLQNLGYSKQAITQAEHIYLLSERGYAKLIKIMDTDLAWQIHDTLIDEYFSMRENSRTASLSGTEAEKIALQKKRAEAMLLNAQTRMYTTIMKTIDNKKLSPIAAEVFGLAALEKITGTKINYRPECEVTYSATELAQQFGVSANCIGKLANANGLKTDEYGINVMDKSPYSAKEVSAFRYNQRGADKIKKLLINKIAFSIKATAPLTLLT